MENDLSLFREGVKELEDVVCWDASAPAVPPSFDDPAIVAKNLLVSSWLTVGSEEGGKEEHSNCFSPSDVSAILLPAWE